MTIEETMTSKERLWTTINLEKPDRTPVAILCTAAPMARLNNMTTADFYRGENGKIAILNVLNEVGNWDLDLGSIWIDNLVSGKLSITLAQGTRIKFPGIELPVSYQHQVEELEFMKYEDYDTIIDRGWSKFMLNEFLYRLMDVKKKFVYKTLISSLSKLKQAKKIWADRGIECMYPTHLFCLHPFFKLSVGRSMAKFMDDLYRRPEKPAIAMQVMTDEFIKDTLKGCKRFGEKIAFIAEERSSTASFHPRFFEKYWWPYTEQIVNAFWDKGIVTWFHLDTNWDGNIEYFKKLPRGSAILALDGTSNIFQAKKILNDHLCLAGDVQAAKLSIGTPEIVENYCKKLIREVGGNGGFILNSGCEIPEAVKMENLKTMVQTAKTYQV